MPRFAVVPRRWVVERTYAWLGRYRRLAKDYEYLPATSESTIYLAMAFTLLHRLTRGTNLTLFRHPLAAVPKVGRTRGPRLRATFASA